jgi:hypothetical protein
VTRVAYGKRPQWQTTAGDRTRSDPHLFPVTPMLDDPGRGSADDLWRTRTAAAQAVALWHDPDLRDMLSSGQ